MMTYQAQAATTDPNCTQQIVLPGTNTPGWLQMPSLAPAFHVEGANAAIDGKFYLFTGFDSNALTAGNRVDVYNPATDVWETVANPRNPMPFAASHIHAVSDGLYVWIAGGFYGNHPSITPSNQVWRYDVFNDLWTTSPLWNMPEARASGALVRNGRSLHFIAGLSDTAIPRNTDRADHWILNLDNPDAGWSVGAVLPINRNHLNGMAIDGIIYALGGQFRHDTNPLDINVAHAYNPATDTWAAIAPLGRPRSHFEPGTFVLSDRIIIVGGRDNNTLAIRNVSEYNPQTNAWTELTPLPVPLIAPAAKAFGNYIVVTEGGRRFDDAQNNTWIGEVLTDCVVVPLLPAATPIPQGINGTGASNLATGDVNISKSGALQSGGAGLPGETITWTMNITNTSTTNQNITMTDVIPSSLAVESVQISRGTSTVSGQVVMVIVPFVTPGENISVIINTTIRERIISGIVTNTAALDSGQSATAEVRVVPSVTQLPATGESPYSRSLFGALLLGLVAGCGFGALLLFPRKAR